MDERAPVPTDELLAERIAAHREELLGFLRRRVPADAEEVAQEVWLRIAAARPDPGDDATFRAFAFTVARRLLIDRHRRRVRRPALVPLDGGPEPRDARDPHADACARQALTVVERVLASMKPEMAQVFRWRTTSDLSFKDIAARQGVSLNTALGRHHSATKKIAAALAAEGLLPGDGP